MTGPQSVHKWLSHYGSVRVEIHCKASCDDGIRDASAALSKVSTSNLTMEMVHALHQVASRSDSQSRTSSQSVSLINLTNLLQKGNTGPGKSRL